MGSADEKPAGPPTSSDAIPGAGAPPSAWKQQREDLTLEECLKPGAGQLPTEEGRTEEACDELSRSSPYAPAMEQRHRGSFTAPDDGFAHDNGPNATFSYKRVRILYMSLSGLS